VSLGWSLAFMLRSLLALLLVAGLLTAGHARTAWGSFRTSDNAFAILLSDREQAFDETAEAQDHPCRISRGGFDGSLLLPEPIEIALDQARINLIGRASYPAAPRSHWPCAAPSTGPPLA
jgi:hypothetical protein